MTIPGFVGLHLKLHFMFCWVTFEIALSFYYWEIAKVCSTYEYIGIVTYFTSHDMFMQIRPKKLKIE